jgi:hypothetical protein
MSTGDLPAAGPDNRIAPQPAPAGAVVQGDAPERIPLAPIPTRPAAVPESLLRRISWLEGALVVLLLAFAFLVASFRAANSDLFLHLATGRLIAGGELAFGQDPFTFTAEGAWINHAWLYDLVSYLLYRVGEVGGALLVVGKALLVVLLAWLMLQTATPPAAARPRWVPIVCTLLAVLALSPRLFLQPAVLSFVLLGATLFLLVRVGPASRGIWLLPAVCALWVNVDEWFLLGPVTIGLFLLGEVVQCRLGDAAPPGSPAPRASPVLTLGLVLVASVLACLINPYHVRAFAWPQALDPALLAGPAPRDVQFRILFLSPLERIYYLPAVGLNVAGLAFFPLVVLGLVSFALAYLPPDAGGNLRGLGWRWWRVLLWLAFLALAGWNARAIPFFAVVAGPVAALNFLDFADRRLGADLYAEHRWQRWAVSGRVLTLIAFLLLGAAGLAGWLQAQSQFGRQLGWGVDADPGLRDAALQVRDWHGRGRLVDEDRWVNTAPDAANYFAWFCADERGRPLMRTFIDQRLQLFPSALRDMVTVRGALAGEDLPVDRNPADPPPPPAWRKVLSQRGARYLAFHTHDVNRTLSTLLRLYGNPDEWQACYLEGRTALFAWRDPQQRQARPWPDGLGIDFGDLAFGPDALRAPDQRGPEPEVRWWRDLVHAEGLPSAAAGSAAQHWARFEAMKFYYVQENALLFRTPLAVLLVGTAAPGGPPLLNGLLAARLNSAFLASGAEQRSRLNDLLGRVFQQYLGSLDEGPSSSAYLAVRNARRAVHDNPDDASAYLVLAQAYLCLRDQTRERICVARRGSNNPLLPHVDAIRQSQIAVALRRVLALSPRPEVQQLAHYLLASRTFLGPEYLEVRVGHQREYLRLARTLRYLIGIPPQQFGETLVAAEAELKRAESQLKKQHDQFVVTAGSKKLLDKVAIAVRNGLAETALDLLLKAEAKDMTDPRTPGQRPGATILIDLLLRLGRLDDARTALYPESGEEDSGRDKRVFGMHPQTGMPAYDWLRVQMAATGGDYELADELLAEVLAEQEKTVGIASLLSQIDLLPSDYAAKGELTRADFAGLLVGDALLRSAVQATHLPWQVLPHVPYRLHKPHLLTPPGGQVTFFQGARILSALLEREAEVWAVRAWLALEHGRTDRARRYAEKAVALADLGPEGPTLRRIRAPFRCLPLAEVCLRRLERRKEP